MSIFICFNKKEKGDECCVSTQKAPGSNPCSRKLRPAMLKIFLQTQYINLCSSTALNQVLSPEFQMRLLKLFAKNEYGNIPSCNKNVTNVMEMLMLCDINHSKS